MQYVVDSSRKKTGVILSLKEYERLQEDLHDLAVIAERRDEATLTLSELKRRLRRHHAQTRKQPPARYSTMGFSENEVEQLLVDTGRKCCICGRLHGVQVHHIVRKEEGGTD